MVRRKMTAAVALRDAAREARQLADHINPANRILARLDRCPDSASWRQLRGAARPSAAEVDGGVLVDDERGRSAAGAG
jgi:hypothetical protein